MDCVMRWRPSARPGRCRLAPEDEVFPSEVRELFYRKKFDVYRVLFTVEGDMVIVLHIQHGRRARLSSN